MGEACSCAELEAEYLCGSGSGPSSLEGAEECSGLRYDTWLVNEFCEMGHMQVRWASWRSRTALHENRRCCQAPAEPGACMHLWCQEAPAHSPSLASQEDACRH